VRTTGMHSPICLRPNQMQKKCLGQRIGIERIGRYISLELLYKCSDTLFQQFVFKLEFHCQFKAWSCSSLFRGDGQIPRLYGK